MDVFRLFMAFLIAWISLIAISAVCKLAPWLWEAFRERPELALYAVFFVIAYLVAYKLLPDFTKPDEIPTNRPMI